MGFPRVKEWPWRFCDVIHFVRPYFVHTPWKMNMEPENTPVEKENHLNQTSIFRFYVTLPETNIAPENRVSPQLP